jgi:scyllo-inositol 2-dehydrogenase (NADP+)
VTPINVGLVGFGLAGQVFHAPLIHANPNFRLTHIVQPSSSRSTANYPEAKQVRDLDTLLQDTFVSLVVVATPNTSHCDIATRSLQAGKHVVVDKPFTNTSADADRLIQLARSVGRVLSVFQNRRWDGDFLTVRQILDRKLLGRVAEYESRFDRFRPNLKAGAWREQDLPGSGLLFDLGSHLIDQAVLLFGRPRGIYARLRRQREAAAATDSFEVHLEYPDVKVTLKGGALVCEPSPRFVLYGTEGSYIKYGLDPQEEALKQGGSPSRPKWGAEAPEFWGTHTRCDGKVTREKYATLAGRYPDYYDNLYRAINGQDELAVKPEQARDVIRMIELAQQSDAERRMIPVS